MVRPLAVSIGDPAGVGPELLLAAWKCREEQHLPPFFAVGGAGLLTQAARHSHPDVPLCPIGSADEAPGAFAEGLPVLAHSDAAYNPGSPDRQGAEFALGSLRKAARLAIDGHAGALVTGPIAKARLAEVGFTHPGQTEFVAEACGYHPDDAVMMLAGPSLRTVPLTVHAPLAQVPAMLTDAMIERRGRIVAMALMRDFGLAQPRLAFAALNPHAGEEGRMGDEEARIIVPAIAALQAEGIRATGPHPADALFAPHERGRYDVALCMYHDQALIPLKALDFDAGVNITLGLPIIRTSADHGTAFGIAGKRLANPGATIAAIRMAGECAARRAAGQATR
jgi:4-hydroxythreonine-4-phosphate dehydrogenase